MEGFIVLYFWLFSGVVFFSFYVLYSIFLDRPSEDVVLSDFLGTCLATILLGPIAWMISLAILLGNTKNFVIITGSERKSKKEEHPGW